MQERNDEMEATTLQAVLSKIGTMEERMRIEMQGEMSRMREDLQSQNQLLLSKISALSSQNSNAPGRQSCAQIGVTSRMALGIFDGADRRKLEARQEKLRASGQKVTRTVRQRQLAFFDMEVSNSPVYQLCSSLVSVQYPMWLVPVSTLLQFEYLPSHQQALAKNMLVQYTSEIAGRVIFVSVRGGERETSSYSSDSPLMH